MPCIDEYRMQALDRTAPCRRCGSRSREKQTHNDVRHGTTTLFAALEEVASGATAAAEGGRPSAPCGWELLGGHDGYDPTAPLASALSR